MSACGNEDSDNHKNGRPPAGEQLNIERTLRPYFENSISATLTSHKTGYNIKTVTKYFNEWKKQIAESEGQDFLQRCKEEKERSLLAYENQICLLTDDKKEVESLIVECKRTGNLSQLLRFHNLKLKITELIVNLISARLNLVNAATADAIIVMEEKQNQDQTKNTTEVGNVI